MTHSWISRAGHNLYCNQFFRNSENVSNKYLKVYCYFIILDFIGSLLVFRNQNDGIQNESLIQGRVLFEPPVVVCHQSSISSF